MLALNSYQRSLREMLTELHLTASEELELGSLWRTLIRLQECPDIALIASSGIKLPAHERTMLYVSHLGAGSNINVSSRGTSKTTAVCVLYSTYRSVFFSKRKGITLSATGFRGSQLIFNDLKLWVDGGWDSQEEGLQFLKQASDNQDVIHRGQNMWTTSWKSFSSNKALPTNDPDKIRGNRAHDLFLDEANFMDDELIDKVAMSFLNVTGDFEHGGTHSKKNSVFYTSTIDYSWRTFQKRVRGARESIERDMLARKARIDKDNALYEELSSQGLCDATLLSFDYSDTFIRKEGKTRDGRKYRVKKYPNEKMSLKLFREGIPFTEKDHRGYMKKLSGPVEAYPTYPMEKRRIEAPLFSGETDEATWLAEQRNVVDTADGGVYPNPVIDRVSFFGNRFLTPYKNCSPAYKVRHRDAVTDYAPSVLFRCSDPCVLGVDYAERNDFSAFVVIRIGPLAQGSYDESTGHGKTPWSNVIWAEQHRGTSAKDVALKIYELMSRYNLVYFHDEYEEDMWKVCRAIGLDLRGGGAGVRDELLRMNQETLESGEFRIYDPSDKDERVQAFGNQPKSLPMLDGLRTQDTTNSNLVEYTLGQLQNDLLYLPKWLPESVRQDAPENSVGYNGARILATQLRKLRQKPTKQARTFYMEGDTNLVENKKDMWAAFIYAAKQVRAHVIRQRNIDDAPPPMGASVTKIGSAKRSMGGRSLGSKRF